MNENSQQATGVLWRLADRYGSGGGMVVLNGTALTSAYLGASWPVVVVLAITAGVTTLAVGLLRSVVPQDSPDRLEWWRVLLGRHRSRRPPVQSGDEE